MPALDNEPIRPGDVLVVHCSGSWNGDPFGVRWRVDGAGNVRLPYAPEWRVAGKRPSQVAAELSQRFSVGRSVTFTVEKFGAPFPSPTFKPSSMP
jgi:protein involved in polysaccharide export with SLBB domain